MRADMVEYLESVGLLGVDVPAEVLAAAEADGEWAVFVLDDWFYEMDRTTNAGWYEAEEARRAAVEAAWEADEFDRARKGEG